MNRILITVAALTVVAACHSHAHVDSPSTTAAPVGPARTQAEPVWSPSPPTTNGQMPFNPR
jgi:hypothetical protein